MRRILDAPAKGLTPFIKEAIEPLKHRPLRRLAWILAGGKDDRAPIGSNVSYSGPLANPGSELCRDGRSSFDQGLAGTAAQRAVKCEQIYSAYSR